MLDRRRHFSHVPHRNSKMNAYLWYTYKDTPRCTPKGPRSEIFIFLSRQTVYISSNTSWDSFFSFLFLVTFFHFRFFVTSSLIYSLIFDYFHLFLALRATHRFWHTHHVSLSVHRIFLITTRQISSSSIRSYLPWETHRRNGRECINIFACKKTAANPYVRKTVIACGLHVHEHFSDSSRPVFETFLLC